MNDWMERLPINEASGKDPLKGSYKVSFNITLNSDDDVQISDLIQAITEGMQDSTILDKIADLDVKKIEKKADLSLKAGDKVVITRPVTITANVQESDGEYFIGDATEGFTDLGEHTLVISEGNVALVNMCKDGKVELVDLMSPVYAELTDNELGDVYDVAISIDKIAVGEGDVSPFTPNEEMIEEDEEPVATDPVYSYVVDLDERGSYRAHVEDSEGNVIFDITNEEIDEDGNSSEGSLWLIDTGYMKHTQDMSGLGKYLQDMKIIPPLSTIEYRG